MKIMKKTVFISLLMCLSLLFCACSSDKKPADDADTMPPGFEFIRKNISLDKKFKSGETGAFSKKDFETALGAEISYLTVSELPKEESGALIFKGHSVMRDQTLPADMLSYLRFVPAGTDKNCRFSFICDAVGYENKEIPCRVIFSERENLSPVAENSNIKTFENVSCEGKLKAFDPDGDQTSFSVTDYPSKGQLLIKDDGSFCYIPKEGFTGSDTLKYRVKDRFGGESEKAVISFAVEKNRSGINFEDMQGNKAHYDAIRMCENNVMIYRKENGKYYFDPEKPVSRMDFLVMLMCASGENADINAVADTAASDDLNLQTGMKGYLAHAVSKGIVKLESGRFMPFKGITAEDASYMVSKLLSLPLCEGEKFAEASEMHEWSAPCYRAAVSAGIVCRACSGNVTQTLTKAHTASILARVSDYIKSNDMGK